MLQTKLHINTRLQLTDEKLSNQHEVIENVPNYEYLDSIIHNGGSSKESQRKHDSSVEVKQYKESMTQHHQANKS